MDDQRLIPGRVIIFFSRQWQWLKPKAFHKDSPHRQSQCTSNILHGCQALWHSNGWWFTHIQTDDIARIPWRTRPSPSLFSVMFYYVLLKSRCEALANQIPDLRGSTHTRQNCHLQLLNAYWQLLSRPDPQIDSCSAQCASKCTVLNVATTSVCTVTYS